MTFQLIIAILGYVFGATNLAKAFGLIPFKDADSLSEEMLKKRKIGLLLTSVVMFCIAIIYTWIWLTLPDIEAQ